MRRFITFISNNGFGVFAWYRIVHRLVHARLFRVEGLSRRGLGAARFGVLAGAAVGRQIARHNRFERRGLNAEVGDRPDSGFIRARLDDVVDAQEARLVERDGCKRQPAGECGRDIEQEERDRDEGALALRSRGR